jgi:cell wall-associated NlpC family hydrolase
MSELGSQVLDYARGQLEAPFRDHQAGVTCEGGRITQDNCMERGMDRVEGYDCSGIVVASLREVLGYTQWPRELRHAAQMINFAREGGAAKHDTTIEAGDIVCLSSADGRRQTHVGIAIANNLDHILHATTSTSKVSMGEPLTRNGLPFERSYIIAPETFQAYCQRALD